MCTNAATAWSSGLWVYYACALQGPSPPRDLFETEGSPRHRYVEPLRLRLPRLVVLDLGQEKIERLARRSFPPAGLARCEAAQGRDRPVEPALVVLGLHPPHDREDLRRNRFGRDGRPCFTNSTVMHSASTPSSASRRASDMARSPARTSSRVPGAMSNRSTGRSPRHPCSAAAAAGARREQGPVVRLNAVRADIVDDFARAPAASLAMLRLVAVVVRSFASLVRSRRKLLLENLALRHQLTTMVQKAPRIRTADRVYWVALRRVWSRWAEVLVVVKPETVVGWHRAGYRLYWQRLSSREAQRPTGGGGRSAGAHPPDGHGEPLARAKDSR